jgi:hypothetical protein
MSSLRKLTPLFRLLFASLIVAIALVLLFKGASGPMNAQQQERQIENLIPKHVPIEVKLTKEKEKKWKDLKNENWARDFELEITNTGNKPIYELGLVLWFDVPNEYQDELVTQINYHTPGITNSRSIATPDDVPIKPGESKIFTISANSYLSWEKGRREKGYRLPSKVKIGFGVLSFGDGTGFIGDKAAPYPVVRPQKPQQSALSPTRGKPRTIGGAVAIDTGGRGPKGTSNLPALLPVNYFRATSVLTARDAVAVDQCEPGCLPTDFDYGVACYGCEATRNFWYTSDPSRPCGQISYSTKTCTIPETGETDTCQFTPQPRICISEPPPPPPSWPTPTPTPTPECASCSSDAPCSYCYLPSHCNRNIGFCWVNYFYGCDDHFVDDCLDNMGYVPVGTCECSHDYGYGGGGGGSYGCMWSDCSCGWWWECGSGICESDGYCWEMLIDPILVDVSGNGFSMTDAGDGVMFDFFSNGKSRRISWTAPQSDDAWLVLDWDKSGAIENGKEMFSNVTQERDPTESPIGFKALAMFDTRPFGGNGDGSIDQRDPIFRKLRLWQDMNHNGISEPSELHTLPELGVESISLDYKESRHRDRWGNVFRYRAKVYGSNHSDLGRWAYDVVLLSDRTTAPQITRLINTEANPRVADMRMFRLFKGRRRNESQ